MFRFTARRSAVLRGAGAAAFLALVAVVGCDTLGPDAPGYRLAPLEGTVLFEVREGYTKYDVPEPPRVLLAMQTEKIYPCANWSIAHGARRQNGSITVDLQGIRIPNICLTALGPAFAGSFLDLDPGNYALAFGERDRHDRYTVTVTDRAIEVSPEPGQFTRPQTTLYWRRPVRSLVYICGTMPDSRALCDQCLERIRGEVALTEFAFPDSGLAPYPRSSSGHRYNAPARYFTYVDDADFERAAAVLASFSREVLAEQIGVGISLYSWKNERAHSWLFTPTP